MHDAPLITLIAAAFTAAWILGIITHKLRLSPIVGYLLAGVAIGPFTPGFIGDLHLAPQLAEIGVILLMFGVGLHFHLKDLLAVRNVAIPGAIGQSIVATLLGILIAVVFGWPYKSGIVLGLAMGVASTVVLTRLLTENRQLDAPQGHVAIGWLIVQDVLTVIVLVLIPAMGDPAPGAHISTNNIWLTLLISLAKLAALVAILLLAGSRIIPWIMVKVAHLRSRELFTLTVLVMAIAIAAGASYVFGASMALGAFLAGMVVGQSPVSQQTAADVLPLRDAFAVLFFASVGMLFDPKFVIHHPGLLLACLAIVMIANPLTALTIVTLVGRPLRTGLTVAIGLTQIGEFSFILADLGLKHGLLKTEGQQALVAVAIITITLNPLLFRLINPIEAWIKRRPKLYRFMNRSTLRREARMNQDMAKAVETGTGPLAVVLGYGPVGRSLDEVLRKSGIETVVVDLNMSTIEAIQGEGRAAVFGDAYNIEVMHQALDRATHLVITLPHAVNRNPLIASAKLINPNIKVFVRAHYVSEQAELQQVGADKSCFEEAEAAVALAKLVLFDRGASEENIRRETTRIRQELGA